MKIPETSANIGAYYGNEENGQWQPNGVIIDSGVGGGVVGSGDAGIHRPVYPLHIPRGHVSGYVMAGGYYGGAAPAAGGYPQGPPPDDFAEYMWMENEEEFDKQVMQQLEEEALMEQCIEAMLEDEQRERHHRPGHAHPTSSNGSCLSLEETVSRSTLNPLAAEFVPTRRPTDIDNKTEPVLEAPAEPAEQTDAKPNTDTDTPPVDDSRTEEPPSLDPPEVSAADTQERRNKKPDKKTPPKSEGERKKKPQPAKSDTKIQPKKEPLKAMKSDVCVTATQPEEPAPAVEPTKSAPPTPVEEIPSGPKPINYAAAAKANKPKKAPTPPIIEKTPPPTKQLSNDKIKTTKLEKTKERPVQRKNSAK